MFEVELKARVKDRSAVIQKLNSFARFDRIIVKDDSYFKLEREGKERVTARIRQEEQRTSDDAVNFCEQKLLAKKVFLTYKKKERRTDQNGVTTEVNDEQETELTNADAVKTLLLDAGFEPYFTKHKNTIGFYVEYDSALPYSQAHLELCNVPPLGDFLEIESMLQNENSAVKEAQEELSRLLNKAGLQSSDIEKKYYSELLEEKKKNV